MKKIFLFSLLLASAAAEAQTVLRVNNTPGSGAPYSTIAAAVTAAGPNDIIMVEGSLDSYGSLNIDKKVTIIGPGYFLSENMSIQVSSLHAKFTAIQFLSGSSGSSVSGLEIGTVDMSGTISNLSIRNNYFTSEFRVGTGSGSNFLIQGNYMSQFRGDFLGSSFANFVVINNYIGLRFGSSANGTYTVFNNIIRLQVGGSTFINSDVRNNIFFDGSVISISNTTFKHNVSSTNVIVGADPINTFNVNASLLFVGLVGNTTDTQWRLRAGSPAIGAGEGGIDCGMYGGATPYRPSGIQAGQHTVYSLSVPATVIQNSTLNVKVSAKVN